MEVEMVPAYGHAHNQSKQTGLFIKWYVTITLFVIGKM